MMRRFNLLEYWHETMINLTRVRLRILAALVLTFLIAGANPSRFAQAAPAGESVEFDMVAVASANYVCVNQSITFRVTVLRSIRNDVARTTLGRISGVAVDATVADTSIGTITPDRLMIGFDVYDPEVAEFTFTAGKDPGTTTIFFDGLVGSFWEGASLELAASPSVNVDESVQVEVRNCSYKIALIMRENVPMNIAATGSTIEEIKLNADSDRHFSGTGIVLITEQILPIPFLCPKPPEKVFVADVKIIADLVGEFLNLAVTVDHSFGLSDTVAVAPGCLTYSETGSTNKVEVRLSLPLKGGVKSYPFLYGDIIIIVDRVSDEGSGH